MFVRTHRSANEAMPPPGFENRSWTLAELRAFGTAVTSCVSTPKR